MTKRLVTMLSLALPLLGATPSLAGPGSGPSFPLPRYLLPPNAETPAEPAYALMGTTVHDEDVLRPTMQWIGGVRDRRTVFERTARVVRVAY